MQSAFVGADTIDTVWTSKERNAGVNRIRRKMREAVAFSWLSIAGHAALRDLSWQPNNRFRLQEALLSVLAGDIFRGTPLGSRVLAFKAIYYLRNFFNVKRTLTAWKKRKRSIQDAPVTEATG